MEQLLRDAGPVTERPPEGRGARFSAEGQHEPPHAASREGLVALTLFLLGARDRAGFGTGLSGLSNCVLSIDAGAEYEGLTELRRAPVG